MGTPLRFPTADEVDQGYAIQMAEDLARAANPLPREPRDQDERGDAPPVRGPEVYCQSCGQVFDYATKGMSVLQLRKHEKAKHPESVETY